MDVARVWGILLTLLPTLAPPAAVAQDVISVEVTGEGITADAARRDALRRALERGGITELSAQARVENYELIRDTIYARVDGLVRDYRLLEESQRGGLFYCRLRAEVSKSAVASTWGEVQNVLDQVGRPKILVWIDESIDGAPQRSSILESRIEQWLVRSGFDVYAREQIETVAARLTTTAATSDDLALAQALARSFDCQIFIRGHAHADTTGVVDLYGVPAAMYNCDIVVRTYYTDTAQLLSSESEPNTRRGARGQSAYSPQAARVALAAAGEAIVDRTYGTVMRNWATQITAGGEIRLEVAGLDATAALALKSRLAEIDGVDRVNFSLTDGVATYRLAARLSAQDLAAILTDDDWTGQLEVRDIQLNLLRTRARPPSDSIDAGSR